MSFANHIYNLYEDKLESKKKHLLFRTLEEGISPSEKKGYVKINNMDYLNLASNDYLGLSFNQEIYEYGQEIAKKFGNSSSSARLVSGQFDFYTEIEAKLAKFKNKSAGLIGASGFQLNSSILSVLVDSELLGTKPLVFFDKYNHASLYFALRHADIQPIRYRHNDLEHLKMLLEKYDDGKKPIFLVTESLFSMDGDILDFARFLEIAKTHKAFTIIDDAHSVGIYGKNGAGLASLYPEIDLVLGTFSKAFGAFGGYAVANEQIISYLRNYASGLIYSTALPPFIWGCIDKSLEIMPKLTQERDYLLDLIDYAHRRFQNNGFNIGDTNSHIIPLIFGTNEKTLEQEKKLRDNNFFIKSIRTPTVPAGMARLRLSLTPFVRKEDIDKVIEVL